MSDAYMGGAATEPEGGNLSEELQPEPQEQQTPEPVTLDTLNRLLEERDERMFRRIQSLTDKQENRVNQKLDKWSKHLEAQGVAVNEDMLNDKRLQLAMAEADRAIADDEATQPSYRQQPKPEDVERVNVGVAKLVAEYGFTLTPNDPEFRKLNQNTPDPDAYLASHKAAMTSKAQRLGVNPAAAPSEPQGSPQARTPVTGGGAAGGSIEILTTELGKLQTKANRTPAEERRRKEIEAELLKHVPRR